MSKSALKKYQTLSNEARDHHDLTGQDTVKPDASKQVISKQSTRAIMRKVLEDTGQAYTLSCESHVNSDYADYASSQALEAFKGALDNPGLTYDDLCGILRKASMRANARQCKTPWSMFMANYITRYCNGNHEAANFGGPTNGNGMRQAHRQTPNPAKTETIN